MMSEDARKDCRTQGKYSERSPHFVDRRPQTRQDKRQKVSPTVKEPQEKKFHKRKSDGGKESNISLSSESESSVRYQENSDHKFSQLEDVKKRTEIKTHGKHILSDTENGQSVVFYDPYFFHEDEAWELKDRLRNTTNWHEKNIIIQGIEYPQPRLVAWYGPFPYSYSGATLEPAEMPGCVLEIKEKVEHYLRENGINVTLNSVLLNLYRDSKDSVNWHSDDEMSMGVCPTIASVSLGETRKFEMRRKVKLPEDGSSPVKGEEYFVYLKSGSLLIMDGCMQKDWQHRVPKEYHDKEARINLTFRTVYELGDLPPSPPTYSKNQPIDSGLKKSRRSKTDYDAIYDAEDFPPLNSDTSPVSSGIAKKSQDSSASVMIKTERNGSKFSGSHKRRDIENYNKTTLKTTSVIPGSEEVWDSESSPSNKTFLKTGDKIHQSEKVWNNEHTHNKTSLKTCDKIYSSEEILVKEPSYNAKQSQDSSASVMIKTERNGSRFSGSHKRKDKENSSYNKTTLKTSSVIPGSEEVWDSESSPRNKPFLKADDKIHQSKKVWNNEHVYNKTSLQTCDKIYDSEEIQEKEPSYNKTSLKTDNKEEFWDNEPSSYNENSLKTSSVITGSGEMWDSESSPSNKPFLKANDKIHQSEKVWNNEHVYNKTSLQTCDKIYGSEEIQEREPSYNKTSLKTDNKEGFWDNEPSSYNENFQPIDAEVNGSDKRAIEPSYHKKSSLLNNLNDDKKNVKIDMLNKNLRAYDSNLSTNVSATVNGRKNKNFSSKESHVPTNSVNNRQENAHKVKNEPTSSKDSRWTPNVEAKEFVPINKCTTYESNIYDSFGLENLLNYTVELMTPENLKEYSIALKMRVLEKIQEFKLCDKEELEVLCEITDGNQTFRNQKVITARMFLIVKRAFQRLTSPNFQKSYGNHRRPNHGNQNNYSERRYQSGSREGYHRY